MNKFAHFLYTHKLILLNALLAGFIGAFHPDYLKGLPDTAEFNYYLGVGLLVLLFFEFAGIYYKSLFIYSFAQSTHRKVPLYLTGTFLPRLLVSGGLATLVLSAMGALSISDFFLIPIILYATFKEFWVRAQLLDTKREKNPRPGKFRVWMGETFLFLFLCGAYVAIWEIYLLENPRIMYLLLDPINWGFDLVGFALAMYAMQMPYLYEEYLREKPRSQKVLAYLSLLLPVLAFAFALYRISFLT